MTLKPTQSPLPSPIRFTGRIHAKLHGGGTGKGFTAAPSARAVKQVAGAAGLTWLEPSVPAAASPGPQTGLKGALGPAADPLARWHLLEAPGGSADPDAVWDAVERALKQPDVAYAEPDAIYELPLPEKLTPPRAGPSPVWHLQAIGADVAWKTSEAAGIQPGAGILVAHLDTGYTDHPATPRARFLNTGLDFWDLRADATDPMTTGLPFMPGHGTGTLGLLAADFEAHQYRGVATHASILPVRVSPSVVLIRTTSFARGLRYAVDEGARVVSISMGGLPSGLWADAVNYAYERGVVMCAAAGNHFKIGPFRTPTSVVYPARFERVIAVSGITKNEKRYRFPTRMSGNDGPEVGLCAPTPDVEWARASPPRRFDFGPGEGTSSATPQVAGAAAMWLAFHAKALDLDGYTPMERVEACRVALLRSAQKVGQVTYEPVGETGRTRHDWFGDGRLDIAGALAIGPKRYGTAPPASVAGAVAGILGLGAVPGVSRAEVVARIREAWGAPL